MLTCGGATRFVGAATRLALLLCWRTGEDARPRGEAHGRCKQHRSHCQRNYDPTQHCFPYNTR